MSDTRSNIEAITRLLKERKSSSKHNIENSEIKEEKPFVEIESVKNHTDEHGDDLVSTEIPYLEEPINESDEEYLKRIAEAEYSEEPVDESDEEYLKRIAETEYSEEPVNDSSDINKKVKKTDNPISILYSKHQKIINPVLVLFVILGGMAIFFAPDKSTLPLEKPIVVDSLETERKKLKIRTEIDSESDSKLITSMASDERRKIYVKEENIEEKQKSSKSIVSCRAIGRSPFLNMFITDGKTVKLADGTYSKKIIKLDNSNPKILPWYGGNAEFVLVSGSTKYVIRKQVKENYKCSK